jgi:TPR repeat protein
MLCNTVSEAWQYIDLARLLRVAQSPAIRAACLFPQACAPPSSCFAQSAFVSLDSNNHTKNASSACAVVSGLFSRVSVKRELTSIKASLSQLSSQAELEKLDYHSFSREKLALLNDPEAVFERGFRALFGVGVAKQENEAWKQIVAAAEQGHPAAHGLCLVHGKGTPAEPSRGVSLLRESAARGHAAAQTALAICHRSGISVEKSAEEATRLLNLAVEQGHAVALFLMGMAHLTGEGVSKTANEAARFFELAAERGVTAAQSALGSLYRDGEGVERDTGKSLRYMKLASELDEKAKMQLAPIAKRFLDELDEASLDATFRNLSWIGDVQQNGEGLLIAFERFSNNVGVVRDTNAAVRYLFDAALLQHPVAIAVCLLEGIVFEKDEKRAISLLQRFAENAFASHQLGVCYAGGAGVAKNETDALKNFVKASKHGHAVASYRAAVAFDHGLGTTRDLQKALRHYHRAANANHVESLLRLGSAYRDGDGVARDIEKSIEFFSNASKFGNIKATNLLHQVSHMLRDIRKLERAANARDAELAAAAVLEN